MIDTKELRLGNWINIPICGINAKVDVIGAKKVCIDLHEVDLESGDSSFEANDIDPIPITEQWLVKLGFVKTYFSENFEYFSIGENGFIAGEDLFHVKHRPNNENYFFLNIRYNFKYVHQLQNTFFHLTGEELEINHGN